MSATSLLAIYGAGGVGRELRELAAQAAGHTRKIALVADAKFAPTLPEGPAFFWEEFCRRFPPGKACFIIGVGDPEQRAALAAKVQATGYSLERFIHPAAHVSGSARIEQGAVIYPGVFVSCGARLGYNTLLMAQAVLGHDTVLGEHSVGAAGANIAGGCVVGRRCWLGLNCALKEKTRLGDGCVVGMGCMVLRDMEPETLITGNPGQTRPKPPDFRLFPSQDRKQLEG